MNISAICIRRPVMTTIITFALVLGGLFGYRTLPISALPQVDFPTISVTAQLPGANPDTMAAVVATQLEREFSTIAGISSITSSSGLGQTQITIQFDLDRNIDSAALDIQSAISRAQRRLPPEMTTPPSFRKVNPADQPVLLLTLSSPIMPLSAVTDYVDTIISPRVSTLTGVAQVQIYGPQRFAVRVQVDPDELAARGIGIDEVQRALASANANTPIGSLSGPSQAVTLQATGQMARAAEFRPLIVAYKDGAPVRLGDIANPVDSVENDRTASWINGTRSIVLAIQKQPGANTIDVVDGVKALLPQFRAILPPAVNLEVFIDRSQPIREAIHDVEFTLGLTIALVILVIFLFLRRAAATFIPSVTVPISLIATFGGMCFFGFSIDNISLLALTLATGLVVDDAIVVLENIVRHIEEGMSPWAAAFKGSREVGFTIISITLSLVAVFIPIFFMGGVVGRVFFEFAVVVSLAILISAFVSLTLTPMLCSRLLKPEPPKEQQGAFHRIAEGAFEGLLRIYGRMLQAVLRYRPLTLAVTIGTVAFTIHLFMTSPMGFFPLEDTGQLAVTTEAGQETSFAAMAQIQQRVSRIFQADPGVAQVNASAGATVWNPAVNQGRLFIGLKPRAERDGADAIIRRVRPKLAEIAGVNVYIQKTQNLNIGGRSAKSLYQYTVQSPSTEELYRWAAILETRMRGLPGLRDVTTDLQIRGPEALITINRDRAASLGVSSEQIRNTLYSAFGTRQVSTIFTSSNSYQVILEVEPRFQQSVEALSKLRVRSASGQLVALDAFAEITRQAGPVTVNHQAQLPSVTISFNTAAGTSLGDAVKSVLALERELALPASVTTGFSGAAQVFQAALAGQGLLLGAAVLVIYMILAILYESFIHPITILSGLPAAAIGALLGLRFMGLEVSVIAIIGIVLLIGIVKKNAIMMIDFALQAQREQGMDARTAIEEACMKRFRPIMMTTMAAIAGALPIAVAHGASAELRQPLGVAVVGGLLFSQALTLFITPVIFLYLEDLRRLGARWFNANAEAVAAERAAAMGDD
ncbi:multidrug transporter [Allostella vacuolata]|nr:multidrug transporter [Stella vacuolata]